MYTTVSDLNHKHLEDWYTIYDGNCTIEATFG